MSEETQIAGKKYRRPYIPYTALTLDANYCVSTFGEAAANLFGHPETEILGKPVSEILPQMSNQRNQALSQDASPNQFSEVRMEAKHADGNTFQVMVGMRPDHQHGNRRHLLLIRNLEARPQSGQ